MLVRDIPEDAIFISDSQDVNATLEMTGCDEDFGGLFILTNGTVLGIEGIVPYLDKSVYEAGVLP